MRNRFQLSGSIGGAETETVIPPFSKRGLYKIPVTIPKGKRLILTHISYFIDANQDCGLTLAGAEGGFAFTTNSNEPQGELEPMVEINAPFNTDKTIYVDLELNADNADHTTVKTLSSWWMRFKIV